MTNAQLIERLLTQAKAQYLDGYQQGRLHGLAAGALYGAAGCAAVLLLIWLGLP